MEVHCGLQCGETLDSLTKKKDTPLFDNVMITNLKKKDFGKIQFTFYFHCKTFENSSLGYFALFIESRCVLTWKEKFYI